MSSAAPDAVYHLAALTHVGQSWEEPLQVLEVNVIGTAAVLAAARQCATDPRVLVTSSAEVYGAVTDPGLLPLDEGSPTAPLTPYAASKLAAEAVVAQAHLGHGQHVITVRPFNHIGPGPDTQLRRPGAGPADRGGRPARRTDHPRRQSVGPAGLHRRAGRGAGLPAPDRVRSPR